MAFGLSERLNNNVNVELMYAQTIGNNSGAISGKILMKLQTNLGCHCL